MQSTSFNRICNKLFTSSMGLPCAHCLKELQNNNEAIQLHHIHCHWHFPHSEELLAMQPLLRNPEIVQTQEHPTARNQPQWSTRRDLSHFGLQQTAKPMK